MDHNNINLIIACFKAFRTIMNDNTVVDVDSFILQRCSKLIQYYKQSVIVR